MSTVSQLLLDTVQELGNLRRLRAVYHVRHVFFVKTVVHNPKVLLHLAVRPLHKLCLCEALCDIRLCKHQLHLIRKTVCHLPAFASGASTAGALTL